MSSDYELAHNLLAEEQPLPQSIHGSRRRGLSKTQLLVAGLAVLAVAGLAVGLAVGLSSRGSSSGSSSGSGGSSAESTMAAAPSYSVHPVLAGMPSPVLTNNADGTVSGSFQLQHEAQGRHTTLSYEVTRNKAVHVLAHNSNVTNVVCDDTTATVHYTCCDAAAAHGVGPSDIVVVPEEFVACGSKLFKFDSIDTKDNTAIFTAIAPANITDIFRDATVTFSSNYTTGHLLVNGNVGGDENLIKSSRKRGFFDFLHKAWDWIQSHKQIVEDVGQLIFTGSLDIQDAHPYSSQFTLGPKPCVPTSAGFEVNGLDCSADFDVTTSVSFDISGYKLQTMSMTVSGSAQISMDLSGDQYQFTKDITSSGLHQLVNDKIFSTTIPIAGIPIPLSMTASLLGGYDIDLTAAVGASGYVRVAGDVELGISYTQADGFQRIHQTSLTPGAKLESAHADAEATLQLNAQSVIFLECAYLGGPDLQMSATANAQLQVDVDYDQAPADGCSDGLYVQIGVESTGAIGADVDVDIDGHTLYKKDFPTLDQLWDEQKPDLWSQCYKK